MQSLKIILLYLLRACGLFSLFSYLNKNKSLVLCYHGTSLNDEHKFMPANYVTNKRFKRRLEKLKTQGYKFISLSQLLHRINENKVSNKEVVITIDDGFESIFDEMIPFIEANSIPATLYVTTMNSCHEYPIFRLASAYLFWKTKIQYLTFATHEINYSDKILTKEHQSIWDFILYVEENYNFKDRNDILNVMARKLNVELSSNLMKSFQIIDLEKLKQLKLNFTDIQLHTHSHDMSLEYAELKKDLQKNKELLSPIAKNKLIHFCYPSGLYKKEHLKLLDELDIKTATTCHHGLVSSSTNPLEIPRLIINSNMPEIVFEAELNGLMSFLRSLFSLVPLRQIISVNWINDFVVKKTL